MTVKWTDTKKKTHPHSFQIRKRISWLCCQGCGLILLNNPATRDAAKKPCYKDQ